MERNATGFIGNSFSRTSTGEGTATSSCKRWAPPILTWPKPTSSSYRVPAEEASEALRPRTGSDLRSTRDPEGRSSSMGRAHLRHRPRYARRSPGRRELYHQSQAAPAAALRCRKDSHLISRVDPALSLFVCSSGIARRQRGDHLRRIRKRREK